MSVIFKDQQHPKNILNGCALSSQEMIDRALTIGLDGQPFVCTIEVDERVVFTIGVGERLGFVQQSSIAGNPPYHVAVGDGSMTDFAGFLSQDTLTEIPARYLLPMAEIRKFIAGAALFGESPVDIRWEAI